MNLLHVGLALHFRVLYAIIMYVPDALKPLQIHLLSRVSQQPTSTVLLTIHSHLNKHLQARP